MEGFEILVFGQCRTFTQKTTYEVDFKEGGSKTKGRSGYIKPCRF